MAITSSRMVSGAIIKRKKSPYQKLMDIAKGVGNKAESIGKNAYMRVAPPSDISMGTKVKNVETLKRLEEKYKYLKK